MRSPWQRASHSLRAIVTFVAVLGLGASVALADAPPAQRSSWGQLKARYRPAAPGAAGSFRNGVLNNAKQAKLAQVSLSPATVAGGGTSEGTVQLNSGAPTGGAVISLASSAAALASVPGSVTIPAGSKIATFTVSTTVPAASASATISASFGGITRSATLTVTVGGAPPPPPAAATLGAVSVSPASIVAGNSSLGTVSLSAAAPAGGAVVSLSSSNTALVGVPSSVTVAQGSASATFAVSSVPSAAGGSVTISASYLGTSRTATLAVAPSDPCASVTGLGGNAAISSATVPQFRTGRLRIDLVGDVPAGWINALGPCTTNAAPSAAFISGTGNVTLGGASVNGGVLTFGALTLPPAEAGTVLATDAAGNVLQVIWPALAGLPAGPPTMRLNLASWSAAVQAGVSLDASMTFNVRSADGSTASFTAHGTGMIVPTFRP